MDKVSRLTELTTIISIPSNHHRRPSYGRLGDRSRSRASDGLRYIFLENDLQLRRNFKFSKGEKVLIIEDVITRRGRVIEAIKYANNTGNLLGSVY